MEMVNTATIVGVVAVVAVVLWRRAQHTPPPKVREGKGEKREKEWEDR